jgi:hypothetical protein
LATFQFFFGFSEGHLDPGDLTGLEPLATQDQVKREYMAEGVRRIPVEVSNQEF